MKFGPFLRRAAALAVMALAGAMLSGCAGLGGNPSADITGAAPASANASVSGPTVAQALAGFENRQRALAEAAEQQGQWAQAAWAWEALHALRPGDDNVALRLQRAQQAAETRASLLVQQARLALHLGDAGGARELLLRALAVLPTHAEAAAVMRALEDARVRREFVGADATRVAPAPAAAEFASLLVAQGEASRAADLLLPLATDRRADPALRRQLSDVYLLMADAQHRADPAAALATVRRSLQMDPRNARAGSKLREWQQRLTPRRSSSSSRAAPRRLNERAAE